MFLRFVLLRAFVCRFFVFLRPSVRELDRGAESAPPRSGARSAEYPSGARVKQLAIDGWRFYDEFTVTTKERYLLHLLFISPKTPRAEVHLRLQSVNTKAHVEAHSICPALCKLRLSSRDIMKISLDSNGVSCMSTLKCPPNLSKCWGAVTTYSSLHRSCNATQDWHLKMIEI